MTKEKIKNSIEGIIVTIFGIVCVYLALSIPNNPIRQERAWVNFMTQARLFPLISGVTITILGSVLLLRQFKGTVGSIKVFRDDALRFSFLFIVTLLYVILIGKIGFKVSTLIYLSVTLFYYNRNDMQFYKIALMVLFSTIVATYLVPAALRIPLP